jgi:large subunit ribosomal protein L20
MRIRFSVPRHKRKKRLFKLAKGFYSDQHCRLRQAIPQVNKALAHAYVGRKDKKGNYRQLWITRINAAVREHDMSYSRFINGLKKAEITINRKMMAEMAIRDEASFAKLVALAKKS